MTTNTKSRLKPLGIYGLLLLSVAFGAQAQTPAPHLLNNPNFSVQYAVFQDSTAQILFADVLKKTICALHQNKQLAC